MKYAMERDYSLDFITIKTRKIDLEKRLDRFESEKVAVETPIKVFLNGKILTTIMASPLKLKEMALGFLIDEGVIPSPTEVMEIHVKKNEVQVKSRRINENRLKSITEQGVIVTSCSSRIDFYHVIDDLKTNPLTDNFRIEAESIFQMVRDLIMKTAVFRLTGGVHSAGIFVDENLVGFAEDVGRHNAVDKAVGVALTNDVPLEEAILITSGRQPADIVLKAARCRIPISVSIRAPLSSGVHAADLTGVTLICFARGRKMNIYSHPERVNPFL